MTAIRQKNGDIFVFGSGKSVTVPEEAAEEIYQLIQKECLLEDARDRLLEKYDLDGCNDPEENEKRFRETFGFSFEEACDPKSEHYLLGKLVSMFLDDVSETVSSETTWNIVIDRLEKERHS